jgi:hypothetical protein
MVADDWLVFLAGPLSAALWIAAWALAGPAALGRVFTL